MTARTTIRLNPALLRQAKIYAAEHGTTLTRLVEEALAEKLAPGQAASAPPFRLITFNSAMKVNVDLSDNSAVLDFLDGLE